MALARRKGLADGLSPDSDRLASTLVRRARDFLNISQVDFATRLGVHPVTVARWEVGQRIPTESDVAKAVHTAAFAVSELVRLSEVARGGSRNADHVAGRAYLLGQAIIRRQAITFSLEEWALALATDIGALRKKLPSQGRSPIRSYDVALALEAAARGCSPTELQSVGKDELIAEAFLDRLLHELRIQLALLKHGTEIVPTSWAEGGAPAVSQLPRPLAKRRRGNVARTRARRGRA